METTLERAAAPEQHKPVTLHAEAVHCLSTDANAAQCKPASCSAIGKFPTAQDLLGELEKDAQIARNGHLSGREAEILAKNFYQLNRQIHNLNPEELKMVGDTATQLGDAIANGKHIDPRAVMHDIEKQLPNDGHREARARAIWNATMLELSREGKVPAELIKHSQHHDDNPMIYNPFVDVQLSPKLP